MHRARWYVWLMDSVSGCHVWRAEWEKSKLEGPVTVGVPTGDSRDVKIPETSILGSPHMFHTLCQATGSAWFLNTQVLTCTLIVSVGSREEPALCHTTQKTSLLQTSPNDSTMSHFYFVQLRWMLLFPSELLLSQPSLTVVISLAEFVLQWFLVLVTLWVNLYKQGFRGVKGEKGEPGQPGLDGLDAPCQLVQYFSFLPPCMQFLCFLHIHLYQCKVILLEQALHDKHTTCMCMNSSFSNSAEWRERACISVMTEN